MNLSKKIRYLQLLNHLMFLIGAMYIFYTEDFYLLIGSVIVFYIISVLGINIGLHRYITHKSFKTSDTIEKILLFCSVLCLVGTPLTWSISHINHHAYPDREGDPYSPHRIKIWDYLMTRFEPVKHSRLGMKELLANKNVMFFHNHYLKVILVYCLVLMMIDPVLVIFLWSVPALLSLYGILGTNILCHIKGYRNFDTDDKSYNNIFISIITLGEGWHNNHHADPKNWDTKKNWWELDPTAFVIRMIKNDTV